MPMQDDLRRAAVRAEWDSYDFEPYRVEETGVWEHCDPGDEWTMTVFLVTGEDTGSSPMMGMMTIRFAPGGDEVVEAYAALDGEIIGCRAHSYPAPA